MRKRLLSASILLLTLLPILLIGGILARISIGVIAIMAYREIMDLKGLKNYPNIIVILGLINILVFTFSNRDILFTSLGLNYRYIGLSILMLLSPIIFYYQSDKYTFKDACILLVFTSFIGITLNLASNILIYNKSYFIMLLLVTICTDTFAFLTGKAIGQHKFTKVSPNKTIEGCIGGLVMGVIIPTIYYATIIKASPIYKVVFVLIFLSISCQIGDLFFSTIKREYKIKDYSQLIPGHGGVLDRIDGLLFVIIAFVLCGGTI